MDYKIIAGGVSYISENDLREALGIVDEYVDILGVIRKMREERDQLKKKCDGLKADLKLTDRLYKEDRNFIEKLCDAVDIQRPYLERGYDKAVKLIAGFKRERDELKEKYDKLKARTNAVYGTSCGYSASETPSFRCNVISYSWNLSPIVARSLMDEPSYRVNNDSIRVELDLTPNANYKGTFDLEDLKKYIEEYGREKKLGALESVDYQKAKAARAELAFLYKMVLGKDGLDTNLSPHEVMKAIHDEYKRVRDSQLAFSQSLQSVYMHVYKGTGYKTSDIYAAPDKLADWIITRYDSTKKLSHMETLCDTNDHIDELCDKYTIVQPNRESTTKERLDYIFSVLAEHREKYNSEWKRVEKLIKEKRAAEDSLAELRAKVREIYRSVVDDKWDMSLSYTSALNDINEEYKRVVHNFEERTADWSKVRQEYDRYKLAVGSLLDIPEKARGDINAIERSFDYTKKVYESLKEFRDNVCEIFDIPSNMTDKYILKEIHDITDRYDELEDFRADICGALDIDGMLGTPKQNDKYILEQVEKLKDKYKEQFGLRREWHARYESEHERANGVQKCLDKTREALRVKDISLETARKQYEKVCGNLDTAQAAVDGFKKKVRELQAKVAELEDEKSTEE